MEFLSGEQLRDFVSEEPRGRGLSDSTASSVESDCDEFYWALDSVEGQTERAVVIYTKGEYGDKQVQPVGSDTAVPQVPDSESQVSRDAQSPGQLNLVGCTNVNITYGGRRSEGVPEGQNDEHPVDNPEYQGASSVDLCNLEHRNLNQNNPRRYRLNTQLPEGSPISIVLVGKTGNGKSATANTIFWEDQLFESDFGFESQTQTCKLEHGIVGGRELRVVDTPGNMDPSHKKRILHEIGSAIFLCPDGYDAIILVLTLSRMTDEEKEAVTQLKKLFRDPDLLANHGVLVFTGGDRYETKKRVPFKEYIQEKGDDFVKDLVAECKGRVILFNNNMNFEHDEEKSAGQVVNLIQETDSLMKRKGGKKYTNCFFEQAKDLHSYIENTDLQQRSVYEREKAEFEIKLQLKEKEERRRAREETEKKQEEIKRQQDLEKERFIRELEDTIEQSRDSSMRTHLHAKIKRTCEKWQKDWNLEVDKIIERYLDEISLKVTKVRENQAVKWGELFNTEQQRMLVELDEIFSRSKQDEAIYQQTKRQFQVSLETEIQGKKKQADLQWMKTGKEMMNVQSRVIQRQIVSKSIEQEEQWMKILRAKMAEYEESFKQETAVIIMTAKSEFIDQVLEKIGMDVDWKHVMDTLKGQHSLKWSARLGTQLLWEDDLLVERKGWEEDCRNLFDHFWQRVMKDLTKALDDERQAQEMMWIVEIQHRGRDQLNDLREAFKEVEKSKKINQVKKAIKTENIREERAWQQLTDSRIDSLCSEQENNWKKRGMDIYVRLTEEDVNTDLTETVNSDISEQRHNSKEYWKRSVKTSVDETCRQFEQKLTNKAREIERDLIRTSVEIYTESTKGWKDKTEKLRKSLKRDAKDAIHRKLKNDKEKLDKVITGWKSFEKDWKTRIENERQVFEDNWKSLFTELSKPDGLISEEIELSTVRDTLETKIETSRHNHEKCWLYEEDRVCQSHLEKLKEKMTVVIDSQNVLKERSLRREIQKQNKTWRSEVNDFISQKEIYWKTYLDGKRGELDGKLTKVIERYMEGVTSGWEEKALTECNSIVNQWKQHLHKKRENKDKEWIEELERLRESREWEWEVELKALRPRWKKEDLDAIDLKQKTFKTELKKTIREKRKALEREWAERNQEQMDSIVFTAIDDITKKASDRKEGKLKKMKEMRQTEEKKWELNMRKERLDNQKAKLDEVCTKLFDKTFEELNTCFPATGEVVIKGGRRIQMSQLRKGQQVLCSNTKGELIFSEVFRFGHKTDQGKHTFVKIVTKSQELKVSPNHHVVTCTRHHLSGSGAKPSCTKAAEDVQIGDAVLVYDTDCEQLLVQKVADVSLVTECGLYAPYTLSGNILVDNILASCYVNRIKPQLAHLLLAPARLVYRFTHGSVVPWSRKER